MILDMTKLLMCTWCGKPVSTPVPDDCVVRAVIECPECSDADDDERLIRRATWKRNEGSHRLPGYTK
jgi:DNA-directed RNA polymerase subunit RPC12/RpoP